MKSRNFILFVAISIMALTACTKEDEISVPTEKVKIFMSAPSESAGLKSASTAPERTEIQNGDTISVKDVKDINTIFCSEDQNGFKIYGEWWIFLIDSENSDFRENYYLLGEPGESIQGSMMAIKLKMLGLYQATFRQQAGVEIKFFIKHSGIPGDVGDNMLSNYSFRLEKNVFQQAINGESQLKKAYTIFMRSYPEEIDLSDNSGTIYEEDYQCLIYGNNVSTVIASGFNVQAKIIKIKRCKYSDNFVFCTFLEEEIDPIMGKYQIIFFAGEYGERWVYLPAMWATTWEKDGCITFSVI